jgi:hypothetical protein
MMWIEIFFKLSEFGFPSCFINLITSGITSTLALKWNNKKLENFHLSRGLRQKARELPSV